MAQLKAKISGYGSTDQLTIHDVVLRTEWNYPVEQYSGTASARHEVPKHTKPEGIRLYMQVSVKHSAMLVLNISNVFRILKIVNSLKYQNMTKVPVQIYSCIHTYVYTEF